MLYDSYTSVMLLGCLMNDCTLCLNEQYPLSKTDFYNKDTGDGKRFHQIIYGVVNALAKRGIKEADIDEIAEFVKDYPKQEEVCIDNGYFDFIEKAKTLADVDNVDYYYQIVRKYSLLREYKLQGFDISEVYDEDEDNEKQKQKFNDYMIEDIVNHFEKKQFEIKRKFYQHDDDTTRKQAGDNGEEILERFENNPMIGLSFESKYLTTLWGGMLKKQLYIRSGDTSSGKSRSALGDLACICAPYLWNEDKQDWIKNPNGTHNRGLYIGCEMELDEEVDPLLWAYISNVDSSKIIKGKLAPEEKQRVKKAIEIANSDCLWLTDMPSFNIYKIEQEIKEHKLKYNIEYVIFDYMLINAALVKEFVTNRGSGVNSRGDEILLEFSEALKKLCKTYDVAILTSTQVNADIKDYRNRDYQVLRGGKAVADKATGGSISMPITQQELQLIKPYLDKRGFNHIEPNFVETVYKSRFSEFPKECKIFSYYNLGTMRKQELFITDKDFKPIKNIDPTIIQIDDND